MPHRKEAGQVVRTQTPSRHQHSMALLLQAGPWHWEGPSSSAEPMGCPKLRCGALGSPGHGNRRAASGQHPLQVLGSRAACTLPARCLHTLTVTRLSSSRLCSARDPASGPGACLCHLPLLLLAPLDVPVGLDDASSLLCHDALPSHRHGHCRGRRALAQAGSQEEPLPSSLRAGMGQSVGMEGEKAGPGSGELSPRG